ncbi:MAG: ATP-dependent Clp protease adaptor ClpS [Polyangiaceae bacterium]
MTLAIYDSSIVGVLEPKNADDVLEKSEPKVAKARRYCVVFYNDDYTTKWFVVHVLEQFFHMSETSAIAFTMAVHKKGKGVAGVYSRDIAETKAAAVCDYAKTFEMPLLVTAEPEENGDD